MKLEPFRLPDGFLLGTATSSLQIEGGDRNNNWFRWCEQGRIKDGSHCIVACDHWNRVEEDVALLKKLNNHTYRMSLEWSRIEPEEGKFDPEAMSHYRWEIETLVGAGIRPLVTLHHFSNPLWFEDSGSWMNPQAIDRFQRYVEYVVSNLGDLVSDWVTINEPNVYAAQSYLLDLWPPGKSSIRAYLQVARNMVLAHVKAYRKIHEVRRKMGFGADTLVGAAHHLRVIDPKSNLLPERWLARIFHYLFEEIFVTGMAEGKLLFPLGSGYPLGKGKYMDFLGVNYYSRDMVSLSWNPIMLFGKTEPKKGAPVNDLGWEIYPEGLYRVCKFYWDRFRTPVFVTENGVCDAKDQVRARFIYDHLYQVKRLLDDGVDVRRYYYWSLLDNFEWLEGLSIRFGLVEVDYTTQKRTIRRSGMFYGELCRNRGVTPEMIREYLKQV